MTSSFDYGDSTIAAKVAVDVEGGAAIKEITQDTERLATQLQAAARAGGDFSKYLQQLPQITKQAAMAQKQLCDELERTLNAQSRLSGGGGYSVGQATGDPFAGMSHGMGASRPPTDVQGDIAQLRNSNPRQYLNGQVARGNVSPGEGPTGGTESEIRESNDRNEHREEATDQQDAKTGLGGVALKGLHGGAGLAQQMMGEIGPGGGGMAGMARFVPGMLGRGAEALGGIESLGGLGGALGVAGGVAGVGLAGLGLAEVGGQKIQGMRNLGSIRGGGAGQGAESEAAIMSMGLNPFITMEQSRQIVQGALTEGFSGKSYDSVVDFMKHNLTDMNMSVSDSMQLLQKNVKEGGSSLMSLGQSMQTLKGLSGQGYNSLPQLQKSFGEASSTFIGEGMPGAMANQAAIASANMFSDIPGMEGVGNQITGSFQGMQGQAYAGILSGQGSPGGVIGGDIYEALSGKTGDRAEAATKALAMRAWTEAGKPPPADENSSEQAKQRYSQAVGRFQLWLQHAPGAPQINDVSQLIKTFNRYVYNKEDPLDQSKRETAEKQTQQSTVPDSRGRGESFGNDVAGGFMTGVHDVMGAFGDSKYSDFSKNYANEMYGTAEQHLPAMDALASTYGAGSIEVVGEGGKGSRLDVGNKDQLSAIEKGAKLRYAGSNAAGITMKQASGLEGSDAYNNAGFGGPKTTQVSGDVTVHLQVDQAGKVTAPQSISVPLSGNKQNANAGIGGSQANSGG